MKLLICLVCDCTVNERGICCSELLYSTCQARIEPVAQESAA